MSKRFMAAVSLSIAAACTAGAAQQPTTGQKFTMASSMQRGYHSLQQNLLEAAEKMPDADYSFRPTPQIRPFSQLISHVALAQWQTCSRVKGVDNPHANDKEESVTKKADAVALLKGSTELCDDAFSSINDDNLTELVKAGPNEVSRGLFLAGTNSHGNEMYGTMAVYLRLKGIVPPTTEREMKMKAGASGK
ncbi:MAG: DinB family protein [Terriglobales bacterium]